MNAQVLSTLTVATPSNDAAPLFPAEHVVARLFLDARTHGAFLDRPVDDALLRRVYEAARMGPTAANSVPMRIVFVKSPEAKERLRPTLSAGNVDKTMKAPVTAIRCTRACRASRSKRPAESSEGSHDAASILA